MYQACNLFTQSCVSFWKKGELPSSLTSSLTGKAAIMPFPKAIVDLDWSIFTPEGGMRPIKHTVTRYPDKGGFWKQDRRGVTVTGNKQGWWRLGQRPGMGSMSRERPWGGLKDTSTSDKDLSWVGSAAVVWHIDTGRERGFRIKIRWRIDQVYLEFCSSCSFWNLMRYIPKKSNLCVCSKG